MIRLRMSAVPDDWTDIQLGLRSFLGEIHARGSLLNAATSPTPHVAEPKQRGRPQSWTQTLRARKRARELQRLEDAHRYREYVKANKEKRARELRARVFREGQIVTMVSAAGEGVVSRVSDGHVFIKWPWASEPEREFKFRVDDWMLEPAEGGRKGSIVFYDPASTMKKQSRMETRWRRPR